MELRHLRYFVAVADELSFRKAAGRLSLSEPAISRRLRILKTSLAKNCSIEIQGEWS